MTIYIYTHVHIYCVLVRVLLNKCKAEMNYKLFLSANKYRLSLNGLDILFIVKAYVDAGGSYFVLYNYSNNIKILASNTKTYTITRTLRN